MYLIQKCYPCLFWVRSRFFVCKFQLIRLNYGHFEWTIRVDNRQSCGSSKSAKNLLRYAEKVILQMQYHSFFFFCFIREREKSFRKEQKEWKNSEWCSSGHQCIPIKSPHDCLLHHILNVHRMALIFDYYI